MSAKVKPKTRVCKAKGCGNEFIQYTSFRQHCSNACERDDKPIKTLKSKNCIKKKRRPIKAKARKSATPAQQIVHDRLRELGCCVGLFVFNKPATHPDIHHITVSGRRLGHSFVIPLHPIIHRQGTAEYPSIHSVNGNHGGKKAFKAAYGLDEFELLALCEQELGFEYSKVAA